MAAEDPDVGPRQLTLKGIASEDPEVPMDLLDLYDMGGDPPEMDEKQKKILRNAKKEYERCEKFYSVSRARQLDDLKFAEADSYNGFQWPNDIKNGRDLNHSPSLTINKTRQHNLIIINEAKQHKAVMKFRPVGNGASSEASLIWDALGRHIEYQSNATDAYSLGISFQVKTGFGAWRVTTKYIDDETFDQEIFILPVPDPRVVYIDPDTKQPDKSDMRFGFLFEDLPRAVFNQRFPQFRGHAATTPLGISWTETWSTQDKIRICEYYRKITQKDILHSYHDTNTGELKGILQSEMPKELIKASLADPDTRTRIVERHKVIYYLIVGDYIVEEKVWPGKYIPIVPIIGEETLIDGAYDCKGHTRALLDSQRMFNYWASSAVEYGALQSKTPYIAPALAIEGLQGYWDNANLENYAVLPFNHLDDDGNPIPAPQRAQAPMAAPLYMEGMKQSLNELELVSGQYNNQMGEQGNERTGKAIQARQRQSSTATYHYSDGQAKAIRYTAKIVADLIPHIYDTKRVMQLMDVAGKSIEVTLDPDAAKAYQEVIQRDTGAVKRVLNPSIGKFDVQADIGPDYATSQEEAWNSFMQILTQSPQLVNLIGDIALRNANFPMSDEAADRLERMVPPHARGIGPNPDELKMTQEIKQLQAELMQAQHQIAMNKLQLTGKQEMRDIDAYDAQTKRFAAFAPLLGTEPEEVQSVIQQLVMDAINTHIAAVSGGGAPPPPPAGVPPNPNQPPSGPGVPNGQPPVPPQLQVPAQPGGPPGGPGPAPQLPFPR